MITLYMTIELVSNKIGMAAYFPNLVIPSLFNDEIWDSSIFEGSLTHHFSKLCWITYEIRDIKRP